MVKCLIESVMRLENSNRCVLICGHVAYTNDPHVKPGNLMPCDVCIEPDPLKWMPPALTRDPLRATEAQLTAVADEYAALMRDRGIVIDGLSYEAVRRMARIQDAWRVAFAKVFG